MFYGGDFVNRNPLFLHLFIASFYMTFSSVEYFIFNFIDQIEEAAQEEDDLIQRVQSKMVSGVNEPLLKKKRSILLAQVKSEVQGIISKQDSGVRSGGSLSHLDDTIIRRAGEDNEVSADDIAKKNPIGGRPFLEGVPDSFQSPVGLPHQPNNLHLPLP